MHSLYRCRTGVWLLVAIGFAACSDGSKNLDCSKPEVRAKEPSCVAATQCEPGDTDSDGYNNCEEISLGTDPIDPACNPANPSGCGSAGNSGNPLAPLGFAAEGISTSQIKLSWNAPPSISSAFSKFVISRNGQELLSKPASDREHVDEGLTINTSYTYTIKACNSSGACSATVSKTARTYGDDNGPTPPNTPANFRVTGLGVGTVDVAWDDTSDEREYRIRLHSLESGTGNWTDVVENSTTYTFTSMAEDRVYRIDLVACSGTAESSNCSGEATVSFRSVKGGTSGAPAGLTGLNAINRCQSKIQLGWTAVGGATSYRIDRDGTPIVSSHPASLTSYLDSDLNPERSYTYQVYAANASGLGLPAVLTISTTASDVECAFGPGVWDNAADYDGDGISNGDELKLGTLPLNADTDCDSLSDKQERDNGSDPRNGSSPDPSKAGSCDSDQDGVHDFNGAFRTDLCLPADFEFGSDPAKWKEDGDYYGRRTAPSGGHYRMTHQDGCPAEINIRSLEWQVQDTDGDGCRNIDEVVLKEEMGWRAMLFDPRTSDCTIEALGCKTARDQKRRDPNATVTFPANCIQRTGQLCSAQFRTNSAEDFRKGVSDALRWNADGQFVEGDPKLDNFPMECVSCAANSPYVTIPVEEINFCAVGTFAFCRDNPTDPSCDGISGITQNPARCTEEGVTLLPEEEQLCACIAKGSAAYEDPTCPIFYCAVSEHQEDKEVCPGRFHFYLSLAERYAQENNGTPVASGVGCNTVPSSTWFKPYANLKTNEGYFVPELALGQGVPYPAMAFGRGGNGGGEAPFEMSYWRDRGETGPEPDDADPVYSGSSKMNLCSGSLLYTVASAPCEELQIQDTDPALVTYGRFFVESALARKKELVNNLPDYSEITNSVAYLCGPPPPTPNRPAIQLIYSFFFNFEEIDSSDQQKIGVFGVLDKLFKSEFGVSPGRRLQTPKPEEFVDCTALHNHYTAQGLFLIGKQDGATEPDELAFLETFIAKEELSERMGSFNGFAAAVTLCADMRQVITPPIDMNELREAVANAVPDAAPGGCGNSSCAVGQNPNRSIGFGWLVLLNPAMMLAAWWIARRRRA